MAPVPAAFGQICFFRLWLGLQMLNNFYVLGIPIGVWFVVAKSIVKVKFYIVRVVLVSEPIGALVARPLVENLHSLVEVFLFRL